MGSDFQIERTFQEKGVIGLCFYMRIKYILIDPRKYHCVDVQNIWETKCAEFQRNLPFLSAGYFVQ